jgi:2-amino-4-hydroxy-6-hydroxymethyldihydropteridine diphosphokinase
MVDVVLSLGSNLGDRASNMRRMEQAVDELLEPPVIRSSLMETEPVGAASRQEWFYNRIVRGGYAGTSRELLDRCLSIEINLGRRRPSSGRYTPRTADIDILLFGDEVLHEPDLVVPHPRIQNRKFCILGLMEIAGEWVFPGGIKRIDELGGEWKQEVAGQKMRIVSESGKK